MTVNVLQNVTSATGLAIWRVTVGLLQMPTLLTTKGALGQVINLLAMNVEPRDISRGIVQNQKTITVVTKVEMAMLQRKCMRFVFTAFSSQIDITPSTLDHYYDVELAEGRIIGLNAIIRDVTTKENKDKSEKKRLKDVPIVQNFPEAFPEDLLGLPPTRQVEF
ncbi:hypothetical protein Tco_1463331 [Tanacetum coccineum]